MKTITEVEELRIIAKAAHDAWVKERTDVLLDEYRQAAWAVQIATDNLILFGDKTHA